MSVTFLSAFGHCTNKVKISLERIAWVCRWTESRGKKAWSWQYHHKHQLQSYFRSACSVRAPPVCSRGEHFLLPTPRPSLGPPVATHWGGGPEEWTLVFPYFYLNLNIPTIDLLSNYLYLKVQCSWVESAFLVFYLGSNDKAWTRAEGSFHSPRAI